MSKDNGSPMEVKLFLRTPKLGIAKVAPYFCEAEVSIIITGINI